MADIFKELGRLPGAVEAKLGALKASVEGGLAQTREILETMYGVFSTVGDFFAWMGLHAMLLLLATMIALYLIGMISPLEKRTNYLIAVVLGSFAAYAASFPPGAYGRYLLVMAAPFLVTYIPLLLWGWICKRLQKGKALSPQTKEALIGDLMAHVASYHKEGDAARLKTDLQGILKRLE